MKYLLYIEKKRVGAVVGVPPRLSSDGYGELQQKFHEEHGSADDNWWSTCMSSLWECDCHFGVHYCYDLTPNGGLFELYQLPCNSKEDVEKCKERLRSQRDVVALDVVTISKLVEYQSVVDDIYSREKEMV